MFPTDFMSWLTTQARTQCLTHLGVHMFFYFYQVRHQEGPVAVICAHKQPGSCFLKAKLAGHGVLFCHEETQGTRFLSHLPTL